MRRGYTEKPCHGCGEKGLRPTEGVCDKCKSALAVAKRLIADADARNAAELVPMNTHEHAHALPYLKAPSAERGEAQIAFFELSKAVSEPTTQAPRRYDGATLPISGAAYLWRVENRRGHEWATARFFRADVGELLGRAYAATAAALTATYADGHKDGRNLLSQLVSGEITADAFNETALRRETLK